MSGVTLDFSKAQPLGAPPLAAPPAPSSPAPAAAPSGGGSANGVQLNFGAAVPLTPSPTSAAGNGAPAPPSHWTDAVNGWIDKKMSDLEQSGAISPTDVAVARHAMRTVAGIDQIAAKIPGIGPLLTHSLISGKTGAEINPQEKQFADQPDTTMQEKIAGTGEDVAEFLMGDEALKGLSYAEKLSAILPGMKAIEKSPALANAVRMAIRQGTVGAAQTGARTGSPGAAVAAGVLTGGTAGLLEGGSGLVKEGASALSREAGAGAERAASADTVRAAARSAAKAPLETLSDARPEPSPEFTDNGQGQGEPTGELTTPTPKIDVPKAIEQVGDFSESAKQVRQHAIDTYQHANSASGQQFDEANGDVRAAQKALWKARTTNGDVANARKSLQESLAKRDELMVSMRNKVPPAEADAARAAFKTSYMLDDIGDAIDSSIAGGKDGGFNGRSFVRNWSKVKKTFGEDALRETLGSDHVDALDRVSQLHGSPISRIAKWAATPANWHHSLYSPWSLAGGAVGKFTPIGWEGGILAGKGAEEGTRLMVRRALSNPKYLNNLIFAVDSGANPKNYVPMIGSMIVQDAMRSQQQQGEHDNANQ